ncbi:chymotrypsin-1-like [Halictus rubicundus]|uniref:chymotrypsin-1-like n=1 Tax=Halictus rubicundus TaxID=77578 RepID=UPI004035D128
MDPKFMLFLFALALATADEADRIVGGRDAAPGQFPYMASLRVNGRHNCGGAILDATHILTAAHCVKGKSTNGFTVVTGTNSRTQGGNSHRVAALYFDPGYDSDPDKDIGVIKLADAINFNNLQLPILVSDRSPPEGQNAVISGWGSITPRPIQYSERLQYQYVRMIKIDDCRKVFPFITTAVCGDYWGEHGVNSGPCPGDNGSPLVYNNLLVGVVSDGNPCPKGYPDIYSSTADSLQFIQQATTW